MILAENHSVKNNKKNKKLFERIDAYCYASKNLRNATNYLITQCNRIGFKLRRGEVLDSWEKSFIYTVNCGIKEYNDSRPDKQPMKYIDSTNNFIANAYFLSWYLKDSKEYKAMPMAISAQIVIQEVCRDWKAYYQGLKAFKSGKAGMLGYPHKPGYYDKETGRNPIVLTNQNFKLDGVKIKLPAFLDGIKLKTKQSDLRQVRVVTKNNKIHVTVLYSKETKASNVDKSNVMGIDLGVDNLTTMVSNTDMSPIIVNGKPLKAINQFYNKRKAELQEKAMIYNGKYSTERICNLTERRNNKVKDSLHKTSRKIIDIALENNIGTIVIGNNRGWKQGCDMGKVNNQKFVNIPYYQLIQQIKYKAEMVGIGVIIVEESYTSGTSYLDNEMPTKDKYNNARRIKRGVFKSNSGIFINADVNAAYQMMKKVKDIVVPIKSYERVKTVGVM